jgi:RimJ/RimL family protein N-acetyltransferase
MKFLIPEKLETERLVLRMFKDEDWRDLHKYCSDEESTKYTYSYALTEGETWRVMASLIGHWHLRGYGPYAVEEKSSGTVVGPVGLWYPNDWPGPEIMWALSRQYRGKGYASEAVRAVKMMAASYVPDISLISLIHSENEASKKLAVATGAVFEKEINFRDGLWHIYRHEK